jgi:hypothetical protein
MLDVVDKNFGWVADTITVIDWLDAARGGSVLPPLPT